MTWLQRARRSPWWDRVLLTTNAILLGHWATVGEVGLCILAVLTISVAGVASHLSDVKRKLDDERSRRRLEDAERREGTALLALETSARIDRRIARERKKRQ